MTSLTKVIPQPLREELIPPWIFILICAAATIVAGTLSAAPPTATDTTATDTTVDATASPAATDDSDSSPKQAVATFAGGCFWCTEAVFERMEGVNDVVSGYIGGTVPNPTYKQVCSAQTGHAEAVEIYYDPSKVQFDELLHVFFKTHDPTTLNRQGPDSGPQYRSSVFYHDDEQKKITEQYIKQLDESGDFDRKIVTQLEKATTFYPAEEYHQDFYRRNPNYGYCQANVVPKLRKFNRNFGDKLKK
ncbi:peptide-methionine (S)-S-oxide reductase MsrA [Stieleria sp. TO1_6]|uniref:peptide-methionine (S)-S-oxide reductase MsrA n=1 Tax=Stieleria tagensis TaxID=2956795 RepID=UPI00209B6E46|nr:peptide-methionine (S)-S-oxide reductase MsrA [Stieleria tagensis]MCO8125063.1 peptide-methionine (S)-S-oxide reductase MsrA [Stieleria tagensis]